MSAAIGHDLVALGEVMLRLAPPSPQRLEQATSLDVQIGGAEANVAAACARLGLRTALISALPAEHAWGDRTVREMTGHGVDCSGRAPASGEPRWGSTFSNTARRRARCACSTIAGTPR